jgi:TRAP-type C4-dicarboxylate transport system permease small subunit
MDALQKFLNVLNNKIMMILGGIAVLALMVLATGNVVLRIFQAPFRGTYEIVGFLGAIVIAFALGYTQQRKDNIVVDILTERFSKEVNRRLDMINYFVTMIFFGIIAWQIIVWANKLVVGNEVSETLKIIFYPFVYAVAFGFVVFSFTLLVDFLQTVMNRKE